MTNVLFLEMLSSFCSNKNPLFCFRNFLCRLISHWFFFFLVHELKQFLIGIDCDLQAIVVFVISIHAYAYDKSEMEEVSMVALSGCIWLQAFVVAMETK